MSELSDFLAAEYNASPGVEDQPNDVSLSSFLEGQGSAVEPTPTPRQLSADDVFAHMKTMENRPFSTKVWEAIGPVGRGAGVGMSKFFSTYEALALRGLSKIPGLDYVERDADKIVRQQNFLDQYSSHLDKTGTTAAWLGPNAAELIGDIGTVAADTYLGGKVASGLGVKDPKTMNSVMAGHYGLESAQDKLVELKDAGYTGAALYGGAFIHGGIEGAFTKGMGTLAASKGAVPTEYMLNKLGSTTVKKFFSREGLTQFATSLGFEGAEEELIGATQALWGQLYDDDSLNRYANEQAGTAFVKGAAVRSVFGALDGGAKTGQSIIDSIRNKTADLTSKAPDVAAGIDEAQLAAKERREPNIPEGASPAYTNAVNDETDYINRVTSEVVAHPTQQQRIVENLTKKTEDTDIEGLLDQIAASLPAEGPTTGTKMSKTDAEYALFDYVNGAYRMLNYELRKGDVSPRRQPLVKELDTAIAQLPAHEGEVFRGLSLDARTASQLQPGQVFTDPGYFSTSKSKAVAVGASGAFFVEAVVPQRVVFHLPASTRGRDLTASVGLKGEKEVLFPRDSSFEVVSVRPAIQRHKKSGDEVTFMQVELRETDKKGSPLTPLGTQPPNEFSGADLPPPVSDQEIADVEAVRKTAEEKIHKEQVQQEVSDVLSAKHAVTRAIRGEFNLDALDPAERQSHLESFERAMARGYDRTARELSNSVLNEGANLDAAQQAGIVLALRNTLNALDKNYVSMASEAEPGVEARLDRDLLLREDVDLFTSALDRAGSKIGQALNFRKAMIDRYADDVALIRLKRSKRAAVGGVQNIEESVAQLKDKIRRIENQLEPTKDTGPTELGAVNQDTKLGLEAIGNDLIDGFVKVHVDAELQRRDEIVAGGKVVAEAELDEAKLDAISDGLADKISATLEAREKEIEEGGVQIAARDVATQVENELRLAHQRIRQLVRQREVGPAGPDFGDVKQDIDPVVADLRKAIKAQIDTLKHKKIRLRTVRPMSQPRKPLDPIEEQMMAELKQAHLELKVMDGMLEGTKLTADEQIRALALTKKIATLRLNRQGQEPGTPAYDQADFDLFNAKIELDQYIKQSQFPKWRRQVDEFFHVWNTVKLGLDAAFIALQGAVTTTVAPRVALQGIRNGITAFADPQKAFQSDREINQRANSDRYTKDITLLRPGMELSKSEDFLGGNWIRKIPLGERFQRAYMAYINTIRAGMYDLMVDGAGGREQLTTYSLERIGNAADVFTGRGGRGYMDRARSFLRMFALSPSLYSAQLETMIGAPIWTTKDPTARKAIQAVYVTALKRWGAAYMAAMMINALSEAEGEDEFINVDLNPLSPYYGNFIVMGKAVDPTGGLNRWITQSARTLKLFSDSMGATPAITGRLTDENERRNMAQKWVSFFRGKQALVGSALTDAMLGTHITGQKVTPFSLVSNAAFPIAATDLIEGAKEQGLPPAVATAALGLFLPLRDVRRPKPKRRRGRSRRQSRRQ